MPSITFTNDEPLRTERFKMPEVLLITGTITPGPAPADGHACRLFSLGLQRAEKRLPKHWLLIELIDRNGQLKVASHGFGGKRQGHADQIKAGAVPPAGPIEFSLEFSGKAAELQIGGEDFEFTTELSAPVGEDLFLHLGMGTGFDLLPPIGWSIEYTIGEA